MSPVDANPPAGTTPGETLLCMRCRRDLTNLDPHNPCPSCRTTISDSLEFQRHFSTFNFPALIAGSRWLALSGLVTFLVVYSASFSRIENSSEIHNEPLALCALVAIFLANYAAIFLGIRRLLQVPQPRPRRAIRILCLANPIVEITLFLGAFLFVFLFLPFLSLALLFILALAAKFLLSFATYLLAIRFMRNIAKRLGRPWLSPLGTATFALFAFGSLLWFLAAIYFILHFCLSSTDTAIALSRLAVRPLEMLEPFFAFSFFAQPALQFVFFLALAFIAQYARNHLPPSFRRAIASNPA